MPTTLELEGDENLACCNIIYVVKSTEAEVIAGTPKGSLISFRKNKHS